MARPLYTVALPVELVSEILEYLPVKGLWTAARVSQQFYAAAWRAGLFIHRTIDWQDDPDYTEDLAMFKDVLAQAQRKDVLRISLTLMCFFPEDHDPLLCEEVYSAVQHGASDLFRAISSALPFLVHLSIRIPDHFRPQLDSALQSPAPRLRTLKYCRNWYRVPCTVPIPRDFFGGSAPLLRTLTLGTVTLPDSSVPAFRNVSQASLTYENVFPHINFREQLPGLKDLNIKLTVTGDGHAALPDDLGLAGIPLQSIAIEDRIKDSNATPLLDAVARSMDLSAIPVVLTVGQTIKSDENLLPDDKAALSVRLRYSPEPPDDYLLVTVSPEHHRWRRLYHLDHWDTDMPVPLHALPDLLARVTYLRLDSFVLPGVLELAVPFEALRELRIDLHGHDLERGSPQPPDDADTCDISSLPTTTLCPLLEKITLFALHKPLKTLDSRRIAFLSRELGRRPALALFGVEFCEPVESALLAQMVSTIDQYPFTGRGSREDYDGGLWDVGSLIAIWEVLLVPVIERFARTVSLFRMFNTMESPSRYRAPTVLIHLVAFETNRDTRPRVPLSAFSAARAPGMPSPWPSGCARRLHLASCARRLQPRVHGPMSRPVSGGFSERHTAHSSGSSSFA